jgi:arylsulfatase A-like enzyme
VFFGIRERQPQQGLNEVGSISSLIIENLSGPLISSFTVVPDTIDTGESATLHWAVSNHTGVALTPAVGDVTTLTTNGLGSVAVNPSDTTVYTLTATNAEGGATAQTTVTVRVPRPQIQSFTVSPSAITNGQTATLAWSVVDADSVSISPGVGTVWIAGNQAVTPTNTTTYTLTASNVWGLSQAQVLLTVTDEGFVIPNFLFIAIDDLKPTCGFLSENPGNLLNRIYPDPVKRAQICSILTPTIDALAASGVGFHRAYCAASVCRPSRTALMTGYKPDESGIYGNGDGYFRLPSQPVFLQNAITLPQHLKANGYTTAGTGKIYHTGGDAEADPAYSWTTWFASVPSTGNNGSRVKSPWSPTTAGAEVLEFGYDSGPIADQGDYANADFIARLMTDGAISYSGRSVSITNGQPWFLACGIFRPHLPHYMPRELLDLFDVNDITASRAMLDEFYADTGDVNGGGGLNSGDMYDLRTHGNSYGVSVGVAEGDVRAYQEQLRHYLACAALADRCVKRLLDALDASPWARNTVVVLWSDHGWYLGEKYLFRKTKMWDEAANCVLVIRDPRPGAQAPGGTPCYRPVSLQDLYPTIVSMAGLTPPAHVAGADISPLVADPRRSWNIPAQTTYGGHSIRIGRWSYIKKSASDTELYDLPNDPDEITNLSGHPAYASVKSTMESLLARTISYPARDPWPERDEDSFESWRFGWWGWPGTNDTSIATANPDGDALRNDGEYYHFGNPLSPDSDRARLPVVAGPGTVGVRFDLRDLDSNTVYRVESTADFSTWSSIWASSNNAALDAATISGAGTGRRTVQVNVSATNGAAFLRTRAGPVQ